MFVLILLAADGEKLQSPCICIENYLVFFFKAVNLILSLMWNGFTTSDWLLNTQQLSMNVTNKLAFSLLECFMSIQKLF